MTTPRGTDLLHDPRRNKSTAFSDQEREALGLLGLLPEGIDDLDTQLRRALAQLDGKTTDLERYIYLSQLQDTDEKILIKRYGNTGQWLHHLAFARIRRVPAGKWPSVQTRHVWVLVVCSGIPVAYP